MKLSIIAAIKKYTKKTFEPITITVKITSSQKVKLFVTASTGSEVFFCQKFHKEAKVSS